MLAPAVGVASGAVVAQAAVDSPWPWGRVAYGLLAAMLATAASNAWNQAFDVEIDRVNKPTRPIPAGDASVAQALAVGWLSALLAFGLGWLASPGFVVCVDAL